MSPYTTSSKSKTFPKDSNIMVLVDFVSQHIDTEAREVPYGAVPVTIKKTETVHKYIITITKIEEKV